LIVTRFECRTEKAGLLSSQYRANETAKGMVRLRDIVYKSELVDTFIRKK
jgi:hypothetical protein